MTDGPQFQTEPDKRINGHEILRKSSRGTVIFECRKPECGARSNSDFGWSKFKDHLEENPCPSEGKSWISDYISR